MHLKVDQGIAGYVARHGLMMNMSDTAHEPRWNSTFDKTAGYSPKPILAVPLVAARDGRLLGVLQLLNSIGGPFDSDDESLAIASSNHAAAAPNRARPVHDLQRPTDLEVPPTLPRHHR